jgi:DNA-binding MarR family transcriptional regulator
MPLEIRESARCTCLRVRRAARRITQIYDHSLAASGLTVTQFSLLANASAKDGLSIGEFAERVLMDPTTLTRNLRPLEKQRLIRTGRGPADRRVRAIFLTEAGREKLREALPLWRVAQEHVEATLGPSMTAELNGLLDLSVAKLAPPQASP